MARAFDWEAEGARLGETLDQHHALVVLGADADATARVALGIGKAQAPRRRVAVCDLLGEAPALQSLVRGEDVHGIVDSFVYGVSINRIAREVAGTPNLYIMPTGTEPVDSDEVFPNPRWRRLASGFREMGALLVLAAPAEAPSIAELVAQVDGAVLVGDSVPPQLSVASVIGSVRRSSRDNRTESADGVARGPFDDSSLAPARDLPPTIEPFDAPPPGRRIAPVIQGAAAILMFGAIGAWFAMRPLDDGFTAAGRVRPDMTRPPSSLIPGVADSAGAAQATGADSLMVTPTVINSADSARATAYGIELLATNTLAGAAARVREGGERLPAATFAAEVVDGAQWFKVIAGAYATAAEADSLLAALRAAGQLDARSGSVVRLPYAFLVHDDVQQANVRGLLNAYRDLGQPVYALRQENGTMNVYAGAFATPEQAGLLMPSLRAAGISPALVYRTGRLF